MSRSDALRGGQSIDTIFADDGGDYAYGGIGGDLLIGWGGNEVIYTGEDTGGAFDGSADHLLFRSVVDGIDALYGFEAGAELGDVMQLSGTGYVNFTQIMANIDDFMGCSVIVTGAGSQVYVYGVRKAQHAADDFQLLP